MPVTLRKRPAGTNKSQAQRRQTTVLKSCHLLELPAELRNNVYEMVLSAVPEKEIDLNRATPPSNTLILTCKQICAEAKGMYKALYRQYWTDTKFVVHKESTPAKYLGKKNSGPTPEWQYLRSIDIDHITKLKFLSQRHANRPPNIFELIDP